MTTSPIKIPSTRKESSVQRMAQEIVQEEKQVIIHCRYSCNNPYGMNIRIWSSTYLVAKDVAHKSELVHAENIPFAPSWMFIPPGDSNQFSLIFTGLPKGCKKFDLVEIIPQEGGFYISNIERNDMDVYEVEIDD